MEHLRDAVTWCRMHYVIGLAPTPGQRLSELLPTLRDTDGALCDSFARVAAGGPAETPQRFVVSPRLLREGSLSGIEFDFVNADGTLRRVAISGTVVNDSHGRFLRTRTIAVLPRDARLQGADPRRR